MLKHLAVKNYALIENLEVDFSSGLTTITGETGSGKSIILGALGLILGDRADVKSLKDEQKKCVIEGVFDIREYNLQALFADLDLDHENTSYFRREIVPSGKSRAFINDTPVNLVQLREVALRLIDIHSQHQTLQINDAAYQLAIIDKVAENNALITEYQKLFGDYKKLLKELATLIESEKQNKAELDFFKFQWAELDENKLEEIEQDDWEEELNSLNHAEDIKEKLLEADNLLSEGELNVITNLKHAKLAISKVSTFNKSISELDQRLDSSIIELQDIASEISQLASSSELDPKRQEYLSNRLDNLYRLLQKHSIENVKELIELREELNAKIFAVESMDEKIQNLQKQVEERSDQLKKAGKSIRNEREKAAPVFIDRIKEILGSLNMGDADLRVEFEPLLEPSISGWDKVTLYFKANKGSRFNELKQVASGGELSRLMLAIKACISRAGGMPTIIFDEIDSGVSGEIADSMGDIMKEMSADMQVISITHLPQIAAKGNSHFKVYKELIGESTQTGLLALSEEGRIDELAQMLSGKKAGEAAIANARDLLQMN